MLRTLQIAALKRDTRRKTMMTVAGDWKFEDILGQIGEFGPYQIRIYVILTLMDLSISQCMLFYVYGNLIPEWYCAQWNGTETLWNSTNGTEWDKMCHKEGLKCERFVFHGRVKSIVSEWDLVCDQGYITALSISLFFLGVLFGAGTGGQIADWFGRKKTLMVSASAQMLCQILVGFADPWQTFLALRVLVGFFVGTSLLLCFSVPIEFIGSRWRSLCGSVGIFGLGLTILTLWAYLFPDWRHQAFLSGASCLPLILAIYLWVPESVRWLIQRGSFAEAEDILTKIADFNKRPIPDFSCLGKIALLDEQTENEAKKYTYLDLFKTKQMATKTLILMLVWTNGSMLYYGISAQLGDLAGNVYLNSVIASLTSMPVCWTVIWAANRFGRKRSYVMYNMGPCVAMVVILVLAATVSQENRSAQICVTALILLSLSGANAAWAIGCMYTGELYATLIRNTGTGFCSMAARIAGILAPQILLLGTFTHWSVPYCVYALLAISASLLVYLFLPETNGQPLPEVVGAKYERQELRGKDEDRGAATDSSVTVVL